ncbi:CAP domain-containing protein [Alkalicoccobacillus murimartini]|uniref:Uncharacterized protein YkwD n=1 Tax=Alkalicoccobacillus murimartini TaxID=171685 RepID=A0ABT9YEU6_9BACI|nr:CAP domain-containing protein [Alkalicoccobacillus murimartini]MDQ0206143.1 uncharacterized protein YkwD [Alkalicoccobacillus murimartini]
MKRLLFLVVIGLIAYGSRSLWLDSAKEALPSLPDTSEINLSLDSLTSYIDSLFSDVQNRSIQIGEQPPNRELPELTEPEDQLFSILNTELGDTRSDVEDELGEPNRSSENEYGLDWVTYHEDYHDFVMVAYDQEDRVRGLYTNQNLISSTNEIAYGSDQHFVREQLGEPETSMRKGRFQYEMNQDEEYDLFQIDNSYVTIFYDEHQDTTVTAIQVIDYDLEQGKNDLYTEPSEELKEGFEYQLFDLTNASRVNHDLSVLTWDEDVRETARDHSVDMADNGYFGHTNLEGQSPFDRMQQDDIRFTTAGENLAYGQFSSIYAHEGLMNSLGHRENILQGAFLHLGVGVAFNDQSQPFYTEKFFSNS